MAIYPKTLMLLGSGELGKEFTIAAKRLGCKVIACDRYQNAPAMQVADYSEVLDMTKKNLLKDVICKHNPDFVVPEIEALAVDCLAELETQGVNIIPNAKATKITMNRDKIRDLAANELGIKTARFLYASNLEELKIAAHKIGFPVVIKPVMSSSGKGQTLVKRIEELDKAWEAAVHGARGSSSLVIIEEFLHFDLEITLLTIRQKDGSTIFCPPIGHQQKDGDYQCSWQPANIDKKLLKEAESIAKIVTNNLGGVGIFGVEFFISKNEVIFSELSPRPHDTGLVTLISQNINEFELHLRAILGIPIPKINNISPSASRVILAKGTLKSVSYEGIEEALKEIDTEIFLFGKQAAERGRRLGVALAKCKTIKNARNKADHAAACIKVLEQKNIKY